LARKDGKTFEEQIRGKQENVMKNVVYVLGSEIFSLKPQKTAIST
jgi:hypothetical protein